MTDELDKPITGREARRLFVTHDEATHAHRVIAYGIAIVIALIGIGTVIGFKLADDNEHDLKRATYRLCVRQMQDRAIAWHLVTIEAREAHEIVPVRQLPKRLPIFDCEPNLEGKPAKKLTVRKQREFVRSVAAWDAGP